MNNFC